jgi:hypothetical protein
LRPLRHYNAIPWIALLVATLVARPPGGRTVDAPASDADPATGGTLPGRRGTAEGVKLGRTEMRLDSSMALDDWKSIGSRISMHSDATCWWLGDWLAFGKAMYGVRYREGIAMTGLEYKTLRNYAVVARAFDASRRRHELSFHHHAEVCALPTEEQDFWLDLSVKRGWSKSELRRQVRGRAQSALAGSSSTSLMVAVQHPRHARWLEAAERSDRTLKQWAVAVLDEAASAALEEPALTAGDTS